MLTEFQIPNRDADDLLAYWNRLASLSLPLVDPLADVETDRGPRLTRVRLRHDGRAGVRAALRDEDAWWEAGHRTAMILTMVHGEGLWVGGLRDSLCWDDCGRARLSGLGASWRRFDPFAGHPSTCGRRAVRLAWRQRSDVSEALQLLIRCARRIPPGRQAALVDLCTTAGSADELAEGLGDLRRWWRTPADGAGMAV